MEIRVEKLSLSFFDFLLEQDSVWAGLNARGIHARLALCIAVFVEAGFSRDLLIERAYTLRFSFLSSLKTFIRRQQEMPSQIIQGRMKKGPLKNLSLPEIPSMLRHLLSLRQTDPLIEKIRMQESRDPTILNLEVCFESGTFPLSSLKKLPELLVGDSRARILQKTLTTIQQMDLKKVETVPYSPLSVPSYKKEESPSSFSPIEDKEESIDVSSKKTLLPVNPLPHSPRPQRSCIPEESETYLEKWENTRVPIDKR